MPYADSNGVKIYYEEAGRGFPIVFAHEYSGDLRTWEAQLAHFSRRYRCIAFNARGFAPSDAPAALDAYSQDIAVDDMAAVLRHLRIESAHVVGLSMGSMTTLHFGRRYPHMARSLVIAGTGPGHSKRAKDRFNRDVAAWLESIEAKGWAGVAKSYGRSDDRVRLADKNPRACEAFLRQLSERSTNGTLQVLRKVVMGRPLLAALADEFRAMRVPTLIMDGDEDHECIDTGLYLKRLLPLAGLYVFPKTGHTVQLEEPNAFNRALEEFFAAVEEGRWPETPRSSREPY
jgi:pimeloyl-ACP methyl ester carboxylesterase